VAAAKKLPARPALSDKKTDTKYQSITEVVHPFSFHTQTVI